ncbi:hypothetical protein NLG07_06345 [Alteromonas sp. LMIT006]|jgi:hypothetical protein|uniref:hypothetical protein n=1 Tax=Alteromonadaceae TaxID=72275 RepID=UPI0020CA55FB|nr:hypothetical protein [Alteromonas sp. LMIT006]UTP71652.1 hypothetical protein NLG07_06345 [Alteromonas sp. LMIT006]
MIRLLFMIPLVLCLAWMLYLKANNYSLKQGKQGFIYILIFSVIIALVYTVLMYLTA